MMYFGPRKLLFSNVSLRGTNRILLLKKTSPCACFIMCTGPGCQNRSSKPDCETLSPTRPPPPPLAQKNTTTPTLLILMLCILGAAFVVLCYLTILKRYRSNQGNSNRGRVSSFAADDGGSREDFVDEIRGPVLDHPIWYIRTVGLQQSVIDSIPVFKYKRYERLVEGTDCSVCLSEFEDDETLRLLPKCSHAFHITCIDTWLRSHTNCPLCRAPIVRDVSSSANDERNVLNSGQSSVLGNSAGSREEATSDEQQQHDETGEGGPSGLRIGGENIGPIWNELGKILERNSGIRVLSDLGDHNRVRVEEDVQSVRRSFSMDLPSASRIYAEVAKIQPVKEEGRSSIRGEAEMKKQDLSIDILVAPKQGNKNSSINRSRRSFSFGRSLQSVPIRMKRSLSTSGKSSLHRNSRSQELVRTI